MEFLLRAPHVPRQPDPNCSPISPSNGMDRKAGFLRSCSATKTIRDNIQHDLDSQVDQVVSDDNPTGTITNLDLELCLPVASLETVLTLRSTTIHIPDQKIGVKGDTVHHVAIHGATYSPCPSSPRSFPGQPIGRRHPASGFRWQRPPHQRSKTECLISK
jgi:hypothetical protein